MADEQVGLRLYAEGQQEFVRAAQNVDALERQLTDLQSVVNRMAPGWELARREIDNVTRSLERAKVAAGAAFQQMAHMPGGGAPAPGGGGPGGAGGGGWLAKNASTLGMTMFNVGAMIEDSQYGFRAVANQLPMLAMQIGQLTEMSSALAMSMGGVAGIVATVGYQLYVNMDRITGRGPNYFERQATAEEAAKKAAEAEAKKRASDIASFEGILSDPEARRAAQFRQAVGNAGGGSSVATILRSQLESEAVGGMMVSPITGGKPKPVEDVLAEMLQMAGMGNDTAINAIRSRVPSVNRPTSMVGGITERMIAGATAPGMSDAVALDTLLAQQRMIDRAHKAGNISAKEYADLTDKVTEAMQRVSDESRKTADSLMAEADAAEAKRRKSMDEASDREQADTWATGERLSGRAAGIYGQAFGGNIMRAMMAASGRGEGDDAVNERLQTQLEARMMRLPPSLRSMAARQIIEQARMMQQDMAIQQAAGGDIGVAGLTAGMAPPNTAMGRFQRSMLARQTLIGGQAAGRQLGMMEQADGRIPNWTGKMDQTADKFGMAVDRLLTRGIQITL
jgi:hypothetical protein